ncbi:ExeM/NucH family extracellular endonuclease [Teredinibacter sp. KSP-S5-2]|uniref:ExeM/NucH family extracellular endonuclease n=1 Tax=Teredinibacter sp. KSP-S5-2 TaxID=3034506 RepID=UPI00293443DD|nr:ExeM/NucH family extracellular endonuclease [Teredinibacter sp. KSP-S5-2]WNO08497.1 ExeM/NucH family extracellular endonuclease [Teredinibacter sp. KSP-S5-2]
MMNKRGFKGRKTAGFLLSCALFAGAGNAVADAYISEIHYDNDGTDVGESIEISGTPGQSIAGWSLVLYNGSSSQRSPYNTIDLSGTLVAPQGCEQGLYVHEFPSNGIQNGAPDAVALVDDAGNVVQFISYEGFFEAATGPAVELISQDIGVSETSSTPVGYSLQFVDGAWVEPQPNTFGQCSGGTTGPTEPEVVKIHEIQGSGDAVTSESVFTVEAVVVGDFQSSSQLRGFFIQEEDADADDSVQTSEGIFVYCSSCDVDVNVGDKVQVTGLAKEFYGMSQLNATQAGDIKVLSTQNTLPSPAVIDLPVQVTGTDLASATSEINNFYEKYEGMLVSYSDTLSVSEYYQLSRFGQVTLAEGGRFRQFTDKAYPSVDGLIAHQIDLASRTIILDDDNNTQNAALVNNSPVYFPQSGFSIDNFFRGGDTITNLTGVLHWSYPGSGANTWRIRPVTEAFSYSFNAENIRSASPSDVGGHIKVASFNVLNYFTTLDDGSNACGPNADMGCRGANSPEELIRQTNKIVSAICQMDADVVGLMEIENPSINSEVSPVATLVEHLNSACGGYSAIDTGTTGTDAITVAMIYKPASLDKVGTTAVLDSTEFLDPNQTGQSKNRAALAQSFRDNASGEVFTVSVNHLKSKGSSCGDGDDDTTTGQGNCNQTRTLAAQMEAAWLASNPTGVETSKTLVIGDLNAYRNEDPISTFKNSGYIDLIDTLNGETAYGYVFDAQLGYLDHALASNDLFAYVTGVTDWHINADEVNLLDYNDEIRDAGEASYDAKPSALPLYNSDPYRSSDHDPVVIGIAFPTIPTCNGKQATVYVKDGMIVGGAKDGRPYYGILVGTMEDDVIVGTDNNDVIRGKKGNDLICARGGDDYIRAGQGDDVVLAGDGMDLVYGGSGKDKLFGEKGHDFLNGNRDDDFLDGGEDSNFLDGAKGMDSCRNGNAFRCETKL